ncbi:MAG TPA: AAA family ATPase [Candidatus Angelobacter sp.]|nr:AAA family ATPase [Candidatus Angelobacter sp.]
MLTRLKVSGFKNLVDVDVRFGPFTCIAGVNGVGKSNLLDAIAFLSDLAERQLVDAAVRVRDEGSRTGDVSSIFHRVGNEQDKKMSFDAEMIIPQSGTDDLGQIAKATSSFLRYRLELGYRSEDGRRSLGGIEILQEELTSIRLRDAKRELGFHVDRFWFDSAVVGVRRSPYISTSVEAGNCVINVHQDGGSSGKPRPLLAATLPRTAISAANAAESPTATLVKREMQSWKRLQLEPSALRRPDPLVGPTIMGTDGSHLPATLYNLARHPHFKVNNGHESRAYSLIARRLSELIDDVRLVEVERDDKRELLTLRVSGRDGTLHSARALSDGTLRFLALAVLELDPEFKGVLCLEEPENGIHPARIPAILSLLRDISTDVTEPIGPDNPLRQVIVNTHSPAVVAQVPEDSLLLAETVKVQRENKSFDKVTFGCLNGTWRTEIPGMHVVPKGKLISYLSSVALKQHDDWIGFTSEHSTRRVIDNEELQLALFGTAR